ncbi:unnamed protein product, partial [Ectocarpus sp. 12 AP-2014]
PAPTPRVFLPALAHLGSNSASTTVDAPQVSLPVPPKRDSKVDVYALKAAAQGDRVQSQVHVYDLLHASAETQGPVPKAVNLAATRAVAALREVGIRVLSLFEVLVFTNVWLRSIAEDEPGILELGATGWTLQRPSHGVVPVGTTAESVDAVSTGDAEKHLREVLVVARGARNGKGACLPDWFGAGDFVDGDASTLYATQVDGLHAYAARVPFAAASGVETVYTPSWPFRLHWRWTSPRMRARRTSRWPGTIASGTTPPSTTSRPSTPNIRCGSRGCLWAQTDPTRRTTARSAIGSTVVSRHVMSLPGST